MGGTGNIRTIRQTNEFYPQTHGYPFSTPFQPAMGGGKERREGAGGGFLPWTLALAASTVLRCSFKECVLLSVHVGRFFLVHGFDRFGI